MEDADVEAVIQAYRTGENLTPNGARVRLVEHSEIKENGWDLNIGRYLNTAAEEGADVATALAALAEAQASLREAEARLARRLKAAGYA